MASQVSTVSKSSSAATGTRVPGFAWMFLILFGVLSLLLYQDYSPGQTLFSNDGPLGRLVSQCHQLPGRFTGCWDDLNLLGSRGEAAAPNISYALQLVVGPTWFSKLYVPVALLMLGLAAWWFFRRSGLTPVACILGGLAATLNSGFFSEACWGVASHTIALAMTLFALGLLGDTTSPGRWLRVMLAGLAVGMGVMEGADVGAIFSLYVAAFIIYQAWVGTGFQVKSLGQGIGRTALVALFAGLLASQTILDLVATNIEGVKGTKQDAQTKLSHWDWATQWSLPKRETLSLIVPGLFGYRMETPNGGNYWGAIGRAAEWDRYVAGGRQGPPPTGFKRYTGGGSYAGIIVVLVALWAATHSLLRKSSVFSLAQRKWLWFWLAVALGSLLLAFGRYAPFYRLLYALPYFSTIRNPAKFLGLVGLALVVLFAFGVDGLWRTYVKAGGPVTRWPGLKSWWSCPSKVEELWMQGCLFTLVSSLVLWLVYALCRPRLVQYLQSIDFEVASSQNIAGFSIRQVGWFVLFFTLAAGLMALIFSRAFTGKRSRWAAILLGLLLTIDLGRANQPWIIFLDYDRKYSSNAVLDILHDRPWEHRVGLLPFRTPPQLGIFEQLYKNEWMQHLFPYYNIQCIEAVQMPRVPLDIEAFNAAMRPTSDAEFPRMAMRRWQITNTGYLLGVTDSLDLLNQAGAPAGLSFRIVQQLNVIPRPGVLQPRRWDDLTIQPTTNGVFALFEFAGALPRASLYSNWQNQTNDQVTLQQMVSPSLDLRNTVLVAGGLPPDSTPGPTNQQAGTVEFERYASKDILLKANVLSPAVLLLNDRFDPHWNVLVDGHPATLLRCNYLMRGTFLEAGQHTVEFRFQPPLAALYISLAAVLVGLLLLGVLGWEARQAPSPAPLPQAEPPPAARAPKPKSGNRPGRVRAKR